jgi:signal transduction histidine kinase
MPMLSRLSLRVQLLASYILLLAIALVSITVALLVFLGTRPAPPTPTYQRLAGIVQGLNTRSIVQEFAPRLRGLPEDVTAIQALLDEFSETRGVRVLWVITINGQQTVLYDSEKVFADQESIKINDDVFISAPLQQTLVPSSRQLYGSFVDPNTQMEWLFGGIGREVILRRTPATSLILLAEPRPKVSFGEVLQDFSSALLPPLIQAGIVGLLVAFVLAYLISRGLVRPLNMLVKGAAAMAKGDYHYRVQDVGPAEIRVLAGAFNHMGAEVEAAQQSQRDFLANVSHDLKTPLASIQGYSQAIMDGVTRDSPEAARVIYDEAARLNRLVVELTDLMRMQSGRLSMKTEALDVGEIATALGTRLAVVARKKNITMKLKTAPMPQIAGDGDRLAQVLTNLISNAIKFTPSGGEILVKTRVNQGGVEVIVQDSGIGIPPADLPRVFERFYQVDKARGPQRGTGLGLAIVQEIVQAHGGRISVQSAGEDQGSTFTVWLPSPQLSTLISRSAR